ncbi:MAG: alpha-E domain-containing protein [Synechococcales cyanobacterium RM1_1_8]|nr:alpha-E domain-containing protein [Synechococcales cyanobacterium RM1_1_8]
MLSRVADSIYWLNRYVERAENVARFIDVNLNLLLDTPVGTDQQWEPLIVTTGDRDQFIEHYGEPSAENVLRFLTFDRNSYNSILSCVRAARENARSVREIISSEVWEQVNSFYLMVEEAAKAEAELDLFNFYPQVKLASHLFSGVMDSTMSHNEGWHFGRMGRLLERADKTARILDVKYYILLPSVNYIGTPLDDLQWIALLKSASAYEMYRKSHKRISPEGVTAFLLLDREFPRSIQYCLLQAETSLHQISNTSLGNCQLNSERTLGRLRASLEYSTLEDIMGQGLHEFLDDLQNKLNQIDSAVHQDFVALPGGQAAP